MITNCRDTDILKLKDNNNGYGDRENTNRINALHDIDNVKWELDKLPHQFEVGHRSYQLLL